MTWEDGKPSRNENEWFARRDAEWLREQRTLLDAKRAAHPAGIRCPRDGAELSERIFDGVCVDVCGTCHGVWLDPGELEQLLHLAPRTLTALMAALPPESGRP